MIDALDTLPSADDRDLIEAVAELDGEPLPPSWWTRGAMQAQRDQLAATAGLTVAALVAVLPYRGTPKWDAALHMFSGEMVVLDDAMRAYTRRTGRGDVLDMVQHALTVAGGDVLAAPLVRMLRRVRGD